MSLPPNIKEFEVEFLYRLHKEYFPCLSKEEFCKLQINLDYAMKVYSKEEETK